MQSYRYVQFMTPHGVGYACLSIEGKREILNGTPALSYSVGVSFCSPKDRLNKRRARDMADGRRSKCLAASVVGAFREVLYGTPLMEEKHLTSRETTAILDQVIYASQLTPSWAYKAYVSCKYQLGLTQSSERTAMDLESQ